MPANLSPEYKHADEAYRQAKTPEEKLAALEEMLTCIPKHKGTEHMQADLKRRIAKLKEAPPSKAGARTRDIFHVERGGAGQVVLIGVPNCGKSAIVGALTKAKVAVTDYPFGTHAPVPGMAFHEDVPIQLVDMPPVTPEAVPPGMMGAYRSADIIVLVVDLAAADALEQLEACLAVLTSRNLLPVGRRAGRDERDEEGRQPKTALILATKADLPGATDTFATLRELYAERLPMFAVSATTRQGLDAFVAHLFTTLDVIRVYCKQPGKPPDMGAPSILPRGSSVVDMARSVHREFPDKLKYACVWGSSKFPGQQVQRDHVLQDRDIVELHVAS